MQVNNVSIRNISIVNNCEKVVKSEHGNVADMLLDKINTKEIHMWLPNKG